MDKQAQVQDLTNVLSKFTAYIGKRLPTDVTNKLGELRSKEVNFLLRRFMSPCAKIRRQPIS